METATIDHSLTVPDSKLVAGFGIGLGHSSTCIAGGASDLLVGTAQFLERLVHHSSHII
jgi:hypothetical protein